MVRLKNGFTLVELLVVMAVIGVLVAVLLPSLTKARETGIAIHCLSRLRGFGMHVESYRTDFKQWYTTNMTWSPAGTLAGFYEGSFETQIFDYLPAVKLADLNYTKPRCVSAQLNPYICPTAVPPAVYDATNQRLQGWLEGSSIYGNYRMNSYFGYGSGEPVGSSLYKQRRCRREVTGSPSTMVMLGEWRSASLYFGDLNRVNFCIYRHAATSNVLFTDGHGKGSKDLASEIDPATMRFQE